MADGDQLPDDAVVVRCGLPPFLGRPLHSITKGAAMKTISADFNAMTEAGHVRLTLPCSQEGIVKLGLRTGDWAWLSDSEVMVGRNWPSTIVTGWLVSRTGTRSYIWTTKVPTTSTVSRPS